jgi:cation diffusion facilitator family transporter
MAMNKAKAGYIQGIVSIVTNAGLFAVKLWAGIVTGSIAITADAWHTLSDSLSSVVVIAGIKLSSGKADKEHPFGHGRWEQIAALIIAFILAAIAWDFIKDSVVRFKNQESAVFGVLAIVVTVLSILVKEALAQYAFYIGRKTGNMTVKADGWHHRSDALSSVVVLVGIFFSGKWWWIDSVLGIVISLMLFYATYQIAREAINKLLGEKPSAELIERITLTIEEEFSGNIQPHHFHIHNYVSHQELTFHIKLDNNLTIVSGHKIATDIENKISEKFGIIATVHVEPRNFDHESD